MPCIKKLFLASFSYSVKDVGDKSSEIDFGVGMYLVKINYSYRDEKSEVFFWKQY